MGARDVEENSRKNMIMKYWHAGHVLVPTNIYDTYVLTTMHDTGTLRHLYSIHITDYNDYMD